MKTLLDFLFFSLVLLAGCTTSTLPEGGIVVVDLSKNYPEKEINLKEIADVSYILPDSEKEEFLFRGNPFHVSDKWFIVQNFRDGDFYFFTRQGKPVSHFNRRGNGPEEYVRIMGTQYDEEKNELFVVSQNRIQVYDQYGAWKRTLPLPEDAFPQYFHTFDDESFLLHDSQYTLNQVLRKDNPHPDLVEVDLDSPEFIRISKEDGSILEVIPVPQSKNHIGVEILFDFGMQLIKGPQTHIFRSKDGFLLFNQETDTMYYYGAEKQLVPIWVQSPAATTMEKPSYINSFIEVTHYQFFDKAVLDPDKLPVYQLYPMMRDKRDGSISTQKIQFDDYIGKEIFITGMAGRLQTSTMGCIELPFDELEDAAEENRLSGELKEVFSTMREEDNSLYMLLHFK